MRQAEIEEKGLLNLDNVNIGTFGNQEVLALCHRYSLGCLPYHEKIWKGPDDKVASQLMRGRGPNSDSE